MDDSSAIAPVSMSAAEDQATEEFAAFYAAEFESVFRASFALLGDRDAAQEVTQEAFSRALARWKRLSGQEWMTGWVVTTALNLCRRQLRSKYRLMPIDFGKRAEVVGPTGDRLDVLSAIKKLPLRQREVVVLFYTVGLSTEEIGIALGISTGTVKAHLFRARNALRQHLGEEIHD